MCGNRDVDTCASVGNKGLILEEMSARQSNVANRKTTTQLIAMEGYMDSGLGCGRNVESNCGQLDHFFRSDQDSSRRQAFEMFWEGITPMHNDFKSS